MKRLAAAIALAGTACWSAEPPAGAQPSPDLTLRISAQEVLLDVVVRDRRGNLVRDLKPGELTVSEDGVQQKIRSFRLVSDKPETSEEPARRAAGPEGARLDPARQINLVSLVFQAMGPRSREFARGAAMELIEKEFGSNTYLAVFSMDYRLNVLQQFTGDKALIRKAVERAATGQYSQFVQDSEKVLGQIRASDGAPSGTLPDVEIHAGSANGMIAGLMYEEALFGVADITGMRVVEALKRMVGRHERLPGRKTVLLLSEGLVLPPNNQEPFRKTMSAANRANVSIYCLDARGLTTQPAGANSAELLNRAADLSQRRQANRQDNYRPEDFKQEDLMIAGFKGNYQENLAELAEGTGGFLIANTNDLRTPLARLMEDVRTHYEIGYAPASANWDGRFRKIAVEVARPGLRIQTRNGYFALPKLAGATIEPFEMAALSALAAKPRPRAIPFYSAALRLRGDETASRYAIGFEVPIANLTAGGEANSHSVRIHTSMLALVKDEAGQVVHKSSKEVDIFVARERLPEYRQGSVTYSGQVYLPRGRYTLETAVVDHEANAAGARQSPLAVPQSAQLLSDITLVRKVEAVAGGGDAADPLQFSGGRVQPALSGVARAGIPVALYLVAYPQKDAGDPSITIEIRRDGILLATETPALQPPDASGAIHLLISSALQPGIYDVAARIRQGNRTAQERTVFTVEP
jgi:VWFA-related protein